PLSRPRLLSSASNLPFGSGVTACVAPQAHQTRVSALSGQGNRPYPASYAGTASGGASIWFPVSCCLSATGIRFPGLPAPARGFRLPHGRPTGTNHLPDPVGVVT